MSNFLKIGKNGNLYLDGNLITTSEIEDVNAHMMQLLGFYVTIENGVTIEEILHGIFGMKKFISGYFSEDYEVIRAFASSAKLDKKYKEVRFYKSFKVESDDFMSDDEFLYVLPEISFIEAKNQEKGYDNLGEVPVSIDENITLEHTDVRLSMKSKFTFLDVLTCIFDEISSCLKSGSIISSY